VFNDLEKQNEDDKNEEENKDSPKSDVFQQPEDSPLKNKRRMALKSDHKQDSILN